MSFPPTPPKSARKNPGDRRTERQRAEAVCKHVACGKSLRAAAMAEGLDHSQFLGLVSRNEEVRIFYSAACDAAVEARVSELGDEANKVMAFARKNGSDASALVSAFAVKARVSQWEAERRIPKKYGNRIDLNHTGSIDLAGRLSKARERTKA